MRYASSGSVVALSLACSVGCVGAHEPPPSSPPLLLVVGNSPPAPLRRLPPITTDNQNTLLVAAGATIVATASSEYPGWPASNATDGKPETSWYSGSDDSAAKGHAPFLQLELPEPSAVRRVTVLGNRDPQFLAGYTILSGRIDLLDAEGRVLDSAASDGTGNQRDFDVRWRHPIKDVKSVRFTSLSDEGDKNAYGDVAIAELQVE